MIMRKNVKSTYRKRLGFLALAISVQIMCAGAVYAAHGLPAGENIHNTPINGISVPDAIVKRDSLNTIMNIEQNKDVHIGMINWDSFDIASGNVVNIKQHSMGDTLINRVVGSNLSTINGNLNATGNVVLINPNGMVFGDDCTINVGGFAASTEDLVTIPEDEKKITSYTFRNDSATQGNIELNGAIIKAGYTAITAKGALKLPEDFALTTGALTNQIKINADGNIKLTGQNTLVANDQTQMSGNSTVGIEGWDMTADDGFRYGWVILRSDANADDLGTVDAKGGETAISAQHTFVYYNPELVEGPVKTDDGKLYTQKDYNKGVIDLKAEGSGFVDGDAEAHNILIESGKLVEDKIVTDRKGINGEAYMLVNNIAQLQDIDDADYGNLDGIYALGRDINATSDRLTYVTEVDGVQYVHKNNPDGDGAILSVDDGYFTDETTKVLNDKSTITFSDGLYSLKSADGSLSANLTSEEDVFKVTIGSEEYIMDSSGVMRKTVVVEDNSSITVIDVKDPSILAIGKTLFDAQKQFEAIKNDATNGLTDANGNFIVSENTNSSTWEDSKGFNPIVGNKNVDGTEKAPFTGTFRGFGGDAYHSISNLTINRGDEDNVGLFGVVGSDSSANAGRIHDLTLVNTKITGKSNVGAFAGHLQGNAAITWSKNVVNTKDGNTGNASDTIGFVRSTLNDNQETTDVVESASNIGGIVGLMSGTSYLNYVTNQATVVGQSEDGSTADGNISKVGGLAGAVVGTDEENKARIINSKNWGNVYGENAVGGISGYVQNAQIMSETHAYDKAASVYNNAKITGNDYVGGIVGKAGGNVELYNVYNTNEETTLGNVICGGKDTNGNYIPANTDKLHEGMLAKSENGAIIGENYVGGIVGGMEDGSDGNIINTAYNAGNITGEKNVGGIAGNIIGENSTITNAYNADNNTIILEEIPGLDGIVTKISENTSLKGSDGKEFTWNYGGVDSDDYNKALFLMQYYSFYIVGENNERTYYYFVPEQVADTGDRMGASGIWVDAGGKQISQDELNEAALQERYYANRMAYRDANITGTENVGGIVGSMQGGTISTVYNAGSIKEADGTAEGTDSFGALIGHVNIEEGKTGVLKNAFFVNGQDASTGKAFSNVNVAVGSVDETNKDNFTVDYAKADGDGDVTESGKSLQELRSGEGIKNAIGSDGSQSFFEQQHATDATGHYIFKENDGSNNFYYDLSANVSEEAFNEIRENYIGKNSSNETFKGGYIYKSGNDYYLVSKPEVKDGEVVGVITAKKLTLNGDQYKVVDDGNISLIVTKIISNQGKGEDLDQENKHTLIKGWTVYGDQTLPLLQAFMQDTDIEREFDYDGTKHNLVTDDVDNVYGRADFDEGAGRDVYTHGYEQTDENGVSSIYYFDKSSLWSPQHGYKMDADAHVTINPVEMTIEVKGEKTYGLHALKGYYIAVPRYDKDEKLSGYLYYKVGDNGHTLLTSDDIAGWDNTSGMFNANSIDSITDKAKGESKYLVTIKGLLSNERLETAVSGLVTFVKKHSGNDFTYAGKDVQHADVNSYAFEGSKKNDNGIYEDGDLGGLHANNSNYTLNYSGNLKVNKADLLYTYDGIRDYGDENNDISANNKWSMSGKDANSSVESVNGFLKDWDLKALLDAGVLVHDGTEGYTFNSEYIQSGAINLTYKDGAEVKSITNESHVKVDDSGNVIGYVVDSLTTGHGSDSFITLDMDAINNAIDSSSYTGNKENLKASVKQIANNYNLTWKQAGKNILGSTTENSNVIVDKVVNIAESTQTIVPVALDVTISGERDYLGNMSKTDFVANPDEKVADGKWSIELDGLVAGDTTSEVLNLPVVKALLAVVEGSDKNEIGKINKYTFVKRNTDGTVTAYNLKDGKEYTGSIIDVAKCFKLEGGVLTTVADKYYDNVNVKGDTAERAKTTFNYVAKGQSILEESHKHDYLVTNGDHSLKINPLSLNYILEASKTYGDSNIAYTGDITGLHKDDFDGTELTNDQIKAFIDALTKGTEIDEKAWAGDYGSKGAVSANGKVTTSHSQTVGSHTDTATITVNGFNDAGKAINEKSTFDVNNYDISGTHTLTVNKRKVSIDTSAEREYGEKGKLTNINHSGYTDATDWDKDKFTVGNISVTDNSSEHLDASDTPYTSTDGTYLGVTFSDKTEVGKELANNYNFVQGTNSLKIKKAGLTIVISGGKTYGDATSSAAKDYIVTIGGLKNGEVVNGINISNTFKDTDAEGRNSGIYLDAGTYPNDKSNGSLTIGNIANESVSTGVDNHYGTAKEGFNSANYDITYTGNYEVAKKKITTNITGEKTYGEATSANGKDYTVTIGGLVNGESINGSANGVFDGLAINNASMDDDGHTDGRLDAKKYENTITTTVDALDALDNSGGFKAGNYEISNATSQYDVHKAQLHVDIKGQKVYGMETSQNAADYDVIISGLQNGERFKSDMGNGAQVGKGFVVNKITDRYGKTGIYLNVGTYNGEHAGFDADPSYNTITLDGLTLANGTYKSDNYEITTTSEYIVAPNGNPDIDAARYNGGWWGSRRPLLDIRYLEVEGAGIRVDEDEV